MGTLHRKHVPRSIVDKGPTSGWPLVVEVNRPALERLRPPTSDSLRDTRQVEFLVKKQRTNLVGVVVGFSHLIIFAIGCHPQNDSLPSSSTHRLHYLHQSAATKIWALVTPESTAGVSEQAVRARLGSAHQATEGATCRPSSHSWGCVHAVLWRRVCAPRRPQGAIQAVASKPCLLFVTSEACATLGPGLLTSCSGEVGSHKLSSRADQAQQP
jgi:hypothetical protein